MLGVLAHVQAVMSLGSHEALLYGVAVALAFGPVREGLSVHHVAVPEAPGAQILVFFGFLPEDVADLTSISVCLFSFTNMTNI